MMSQRVIFPDTSAEVSVTEVISILHKDAISMTTIMPSDLHPCPDTSADSSGPEANLRSSHRGTFDNPHNDDSKTTFPGYISSGTGFDFIIQMRF